MYEPVKRAIDTGSRRRIRPYIVTMGTEAGNIMATIGRRAWSRNTTHPAAARPTRVRRMTLRCRATAGGRVGATGFTGRRLAPPPEGVGEPAQVLAGVFDAERRHPRLRYRRDPEDGPGGMGDDVRQRHRVAVLQGDRRPGEVHRVAHHHVVAVPGALDRDRGLFDPEELAEQRPERRRWPTERPRQDLTELVDLRRAGAVVDEHAEPP